MPGIDIQQIKIVTIQIDHHVKVLIDERINELIRDQNENQHCMSWPTNECNRLLRLNFWLARTWRNKSEVFDNHDNFIYRNNDSFNTGPILDQIGAQA